MNQTDPIDTETIEIEIRIKDNVESRGFSGREYRYDAAITETLLEASDPQAVVESHVHRALDSTLRQFIEDRGDLDA